MCKDIAFEQGALQFTIGHFMKLFYAANTTRFDCIDYCHSKTRSSYAHHHCVLDWFRENRLGMNPYDDDDDDDDDNDDDKSCIH